ncbi:predicted protein, partial [Arabidopsis lyrata subsp. lyrata]
MKILNDMWGEAERHSSLLKAKKIRRPHLKMVDDWSILEPSRVLKMLESSWILEMLKPNRVLENIKPSWVMIFGLEPSRVLMILES